MTVNKVAGNFHFAPGKSIDKDNSHIHDMHEIINRQCDFTHTVHYLTFGPVVQGMRNPLDGMTRTIKNKNSHFIQYFIKGTVVVPCALMCCIVVGSQYHWTNGTKVLTNQFSVTEHMRDVSGPLGIGHVALPGVFFEFDISPMLVVHREVSKSSFYFIISVCAVVGGVFTVAGMIDTALHRTSKVLQYKLE